MTQTFFEKKIKPMLLYVGTIGAIMMSIGYVILMFVLVLGFKASTDLTQSMIFAAINAIVGFIIMQFLKIQGIDFAKQLPNNIELMTKYHSLIAKKPKKPKYHTLRYFWTKSIIGDALGKALMTAITTAGIIYIVIEGSNDYNMLLLSVVNLILFACFGLISLVKAYEFYNNQYMPFITEQINEKNEEARIAAEETITKEQQKREKIIEAEVKRRLDLAQKELIQQTDDRLCNSGRDNILESSVDMSSTCIDSESMVLDSSDDNNSVLGGSIYSSDRTTDTVHTFAEKNTLKN